MNLDSKHNILALVGKTNKTTVLQIVQYCLLPSFFSLAGQLPDQDLFGDDQPHLGDDAQRV